MKIKKRDVFNGLIGGIIFYLAWVCLSIILPYFFPEVKYCTYGVAGGCVSYFRRVSFIFSLPGNLLYILLIFIPLIGDFILNLLSEIIYLLPTAKNLQVYEYLLAILSGPFYFILTIVFSALISSKRKMK